MTETNGVPQNPKRKGQSGGPLRASMAFEDRFDVYEWLREHRKEQIAAGSPPKVLALEAVKELGFAISPSTVANLIKKGVKKGVFVRPRKRKSNPPESPKLVKVGDMAVMIEALLDMRRDLTNQPLSPALDRLAKKYVMLFSAKQQELLDDDEDENEDEDDNEAENE